MRRKPDFVLPMQGEREVLEIYGWTIPSEAARVVPCAACGGDGGHHDFAGHWAACIACAGTGEAEIDLEDIEMDDLEDASRVAVSSPMTSNNSGGE